MTRWLLPKRKPYSTSTQQVLLLNYPTHFPADLVAALTDLQVDNFTHFEVGIEPISSEKSVSTL